MLAIAVDLEAKSQRAKAFADQAQKTFGEGHGLSVRIHGQVLHDIAESIIRILEGDDERRSTNKG